MDYEDGFLTGPLHRVLVSLRTAWSASLARCTSCVWSGTQQGTSCSHAKAWISLHLCGSPPGQLQQRLLSLMLVRLPRVSHLVLRDNIQRGWGERLLKSENHLRLTDGGTWEETKEREKYPVVPLQQSGLVCEKPWPHFTHRLTWHGLLPHWACLWQSTGRSCPEGLWSLLLWRYSRPAWTRCCAACSGWPCFGRGLD